MVSERTSPLYPDSRIRKKKNRILPKRSRFGQRFGPSDSREAAKSPSGVGFFLSFLGLCGFARVPSGRLLGKRRWLQGALHFVMPEVVRCERHSCRLILKILPACGEVAARRADGGGSSPGAAPRRTPLPPRFARSPSLLAGRIGRALRPTGPTISCSGAYHRHSP